MAQSIPKEMFNVMIKKYLEGVLSKTNGESELEVKFGTRNIKTITKDDYENVIQKLISTGFTIVNENIYTLKIQSEFIDPNTGIVKLSNIRTEINGLNDIQRYCKTDRLEGINYKFLQKSIATDGAETVKPINFDDYNFRISYQKEKIIPSTSQTGNTIVSTWLDNKKVFRYIQRTSLIHPNYPVIIDISIVKESHKKDGKMIPEYSFLASHVTENTPKYEVEIECNNKLVGPGTKFNNHIILADILRSVIKTILSGLQGTNFPVSYDDIINTQKDYYYLLFPEEKKQSKQKEFIELNPKLFIGPSSKTLQIANIVPINDECTIPNIRKNFTVTDKADGLRKMLYISPKGRIYLLHTNMNFEFTGAISKEEKLFNTLIDGEHILHNKNKEFINLFAAFDIYFVNGKDVRAYPFVPDFEQEESADQNKFRLSILNETIARLKPTCVIEGELSPIKIMAKKFRVSTPKVNIFICAGTILEQRDKGLFDYNTDGLIFTPTNFGVGSNEINKAGPLMKITWDLSFKWKPVDYNTIDFLVTTKKGVNGKDIIQNIFESGLNTVMDKTLTQYKTLILRVGYDEKKHGYLNPCANLIEDKFPSVGDVDNEQGYKPVPFYPTNPFDPEAHICNIPLVSDPNGVLQMFSEDKEVFDDETIVEFKYDISKPEHWRWTPIKVRQDKTAEYRAGYKNYGNAYHVANDNWNSIHNPITEKMIKTGQDIPNELADDDVYYNRISGNNNTRALRDFHNLFVKKLLITSVSKKGNTLIDYAVGKGGDIPKWISAQLSFVLGIDISKDNIENRLDGACARYINYRKKFKTMPYALFLNGDSSVNIKNGNAIFSEKGKQIIKAIFGEGPKDETQLGKGVYRQYAKGVDGFNVSSIQFAIHYMFENIQKCNQFLKNLSECTKVDGYFIGTCYDGNTIFNNLKNLKKGESISIHKDDKLIWQVTKGYDHDSFLDDITSIGYQIDVYQESINKTFREYLVNFNYLTQLMENYGFVLLKNDESELLGLPRASGMFSTLFTLMEQQIDKNKNKKNEYGYALSMDSYEKQISFYNRYFVFKKIRNVDTEDVYESNTGVNVIEQNFNKRQTEIAQKIAKEMKESKGETIKPKTKTLSLVEEEVVEEPVVSKLFKKTKTPKISKKVEMELGSKLKTVEEEIPKEITIKTQISDIPSKKTSRKSKILETLEEQEIIPIKITEKPEEEIKPITKSKKITKKTKLVLPEEEEED